MWFPNEVRFGQQNTTTRLCAEKGTRPRTVKQQQFEYAYLLVLPAYQQEQLKPSFLL
jgi:hypothetical protein